ncbi:uncharacterized protein MELLADRAFT_37213, partial [Melampsora larici-populina 98AG31]
TREIVALKKIPLEAEDKVVPSAAICEISILKEMNDANIVRILDIYHMEVKISVVFGFLDLDLNQYMDKVEFFYALSRVMQLRRYAIVRVQLYCHDHLWDTK